MRRSSPAWHVASSVLFSYERRLGGATRILPAPTRSNRHGRRWASIPTTTMTALGTARRPAPARGGRLPQQPVRGKKTRSVVKLADLPQSLPPLPPASWAEDAVRGKGTEVNALDAQDGGEAAATTTPRRGGRKKIVEVALDAQDDGEAVPTPKPRRGRRKKTVELTDVVSGAEDAARERGIGKEAEGEALDIQGGDGDAGPSPKPRRTRRRNTVNLADLPQGPLSLQPGDGMNGGGLVGESEAGSAYPTVIQQARNNMARFENCVLLTRVGSFYELYFAHADEYGPLLNLKVAAKKTTLGPVPMAGFPFYQLDRVLKILVQEQQCYVAIAEEFPRNPSDRIKAGGLQNDRRVTRVITPGTLIDENFMDPLVNNYVMAIHVEPPTAATANGSNHTTTAATGSTLGDDETTAAETADEPALGLAWLDVSTGQFYTQETTLGGLSSILARVGPREVVVDERLQAEGDHALFAILAEDKHLISYSAHRELLPPTAWGPMLEAEIPAATLAEFGAGEEKAGSLLLQYVGERLLGLSMRLQPPVRHQSLRVMTIDKNSMRALEIKQTMRDAAFRGSLLHAIRRTVTTGGARLLHEWLAAPSTDLDVITRRQDLVARFLESPDLRDHVVQLLRRSHDSQRLVQKFAFGRGDPDNLLGLANTIRATEDIVALLRATDGGPAAPFGPLLARIDVDHVSQLADRIRDSIDEDGLVQQHELAEDEASQVLTLAQGVVSAQGAAEDAALLPKSAKLKKRAAVAVAAAASSSARAAYADDGWTFTMKRGASPGLESLHAELDELGREKTALEAQLRARLGAASLTLRWAASLGHVCHVRGRDARKASMPPLVSSSRSTRTFHEPEWTGLGQRIHQTRFQVQAEEARLFAELRAHVVLNLVRLRRNAAVLDELDVAAAFARLAAEQGLVRPVLGADDARTVIVGGRHPTVEGGLREQGRSFTDNDCLVGAPGHGRLWLITGPNMAGKSTYLRQNALIAVLAQVGCYVPAHHAELGLVDAVFSRVGSADNLYRDQSTFMVEMLETAQILRAATSRSFVIMDEIGRGTAPQDGAAVAFASLYHLATVNKCRTLFATHFHTLADMARDRGMRVADGGPVEMYCTDVAEDGQGGFVYIHKLRKGINRESHALKVAQLAGLPKATIDMAQAILNQEAPPQHGIHDTSRPEAPHHEDSVSSGR